MPKGNAGGFTATREGTKGFYERAAELLRQNALVAEEKKRKVR